MEAIGQIVDTKNLVEYDAIEPLFDLRKKSVANMINVGKLFIECYTKFDSFIPRLKNDEGDNFAEIARTYLQQYEEIANGIREILKYYQDGEGIGDHVLLYRLDIYVSNNQAKCNQFINTFFLIMGSEL